MVRRRRKNSLPTTNMANPLLSHYEKDHSGQRTRIRQRTAVGGGGGGGGVVAALQRNLLLVPIVLHLILLSSRPITIATTSYAWMLAPSTSVTKHVPTGSRSFNMINKCRRRPPAPSRSLPSDDSQFTILHARRNKQSDSSDSGSLDSWYDPVDERATPDQVFWEEMERQNSLIGSSSSSVGAGAGEIGPTAPEDAAFPGAAASDANRQLFASAGGTNRFPAAATDASSMSSMMMGQQQQQQSPPSSFFSGSSNMPQPPTATGESKVMTPKSVEAALARYGSFQVSDNWLNEDLIELMAHQGMTESDEDFYKGVPSLEDQLDDWAKEDKDRGSSGGDWVVPPDDPWDKWGEALKEGEDEDEDRDDESTGYRIRIDEDDPRRQPSEFLFDDQDDDDEDHRTPYSQAEQEEEKDYLERLSKISVVSPRLERARDNPKAAAFFQREPDETEGFDRMWVAAIDNVCFSNLVGTFRNYGIQFCDNFGDWTDGSASDNFATIEDVASRKARLVYEVTGLPCIAARTSFEIEPVPDLGNSDSSSGGASRSSAAQAALLNNPRVRSGYRFNDVGVHVDYLCETLRPLSEPDRVTCLKTCLCYYDGEMEIFDYGICDVDLHFANSLRTFIPVAQAINEMMKTLELTFGLEYQPWLRKRQDEVLFGSGAGDGGRVSMKLRDRVLKEGKVLPNDIVDVSTFMDSMVDVNLMDECAKELSDRFIKEKPSKILTVATTGLVIALPMAKYLQVPVVYARKERSVVMADTYIAAYSSKTVGKNRELLVSKSHLHEDDRVLIVDDFLSSGSSQEAMLRIVFDAGATAVGVGVLLEKVYDSGRQSLSGFDVPIHSLCRIASVQSGVIQLVEEEGFDLMQKEKEKRSNENAQKK